MHSGIMNYVPNSLNILLQKVDLVANTPELQHVYTTLLLSNLNKN